MGDKKVKNGHTLSTKIVGRSTKYQKPDMRYKINKQNALLNLKNKTRAKKTLDVRSKVKSASITISKQV
jgi:hypothetical protein